ncbi:poly(glycerol-phosphate) alpha-glucosyltransferase [Paenilisteria weihenstephanensis]|nr:poly(glycerol-phosphate) alpha-glucosyltransferase [Listeria weihenstephanensis]
MIFNTALEEIKGNVKRMTGDLPNYNLNGEWKAFLSIDHQTKRATVINYSNASLDYIFTQIKKVLEKNNTKTFKVDIAYDFRKIIFEEWNKKALHTRKNYCRSGISFDKGFQTALMEQEINGNAMIQPGESGLALNLENLNRYLLQADKCRRKFEIEVDSELILFETLGFYFDGEKIIKLYSEGLNNGRRILDSMDTPEVERVIHQSGSYLANQVATSGEFVYGYFACFDKKIKHYNSLRHASSTYSMVEAFEVSRDATIITAAKRALQFLAVDLIRETEDRAYVVERDSNEIKLGANAAAILAFTKYMKVTETNDYTALCTKLARTICDLQQENGQFVHVLSYPSLEVKDPFRIIYYDGEAVFALLRLYEIDANQDWLDAAVQAFDHFIAKKYWKNHDHWLSYCTNEITKYLPEDRYFKFGLKNGFGRLEFMYERETAFPTFLELTVATHDMCNRMDELGKSALLAGYDREQLERTIDKRADHQLNSFFYPELAMYFKNPARIENSFFIRHHSFRVRIDDVEHNISGYCRYLNRMKAGFLEKNKEKMQL